MLRTFAPLLLFFLSYSLGAADYGVEKINFFPDAKAWFQAGYKHTNLDITTPKEVTDSRDVHNIYNLFEATYGHRVARKFFAGVKLGIEEASENAAVYGIPLERRSTSAGVTDPRIFGLYRLRHQKKEKGNIDLFLSFSPSPGRRKISSSSTNRFSGRNTTTFLLSHGYHEEKWEFKNSFGGSYLSAGREDNEFLGGTRIRLEDSFTVDYAFSAQYASGKKTFVNATIGFTYRSSEIGRQRDGDKRELRSGTGSIMGLSMKRLFSEWSLIEGGYSLKRSEYFVKAEDVNLDGDLASHEFHLSYLILF